VDHLPASDCLLPEVFRRIVSTPELTYAKTSSVLRDDRESLSRVRGSGKSARRKKDATRRSGHADEATIAGLDRYKGMLSALTDPRATPDSEAARLLTTAKPIYYVVSGMHSPETGGPEMLVELAYRLVVEESPFIQSIRNNVITIITPVLEVDGREKQVDTYRFNKTRAQGDARLPLIYWGKYVAHDDNRDGMGQYLKLTQAITRLTLEWHPTITHDLHEAQTYLYASTGTGPYNDALDPITISEWWTLAENDVMEMTKRGVPGVWTYGYYDGWVPNYMIFIAHSHNAVGPSTSTGLRPENPSVERSGARSRISQSAVVVHQMGSSEQHEHSGISAALFPDHVARIGSCIRELLAEEQASGGQGKTGPVYGWVIPPIGSANPWQRP
jgi:hypothetical protein